MHYCKFAVFETPFCVWEFEAEERNRQFLDGIDPKYFVHMGDVHGRELEGDNRQHAAIALRLAYAQALETFFAFLAAAIQAPQFPLAWILRYQMRDLRSVVSAIGGAGLKYSAFSDPVTWKNVSNTINHFSLADSQTDEEIKLGFARMWSRFAGEFLDEKAADEYNSLKHGLRASAGGFFLSFGIEPAYGVAAPPQAMSVPQGSHFGSSYFITEWLGSPKVNFRARRAARNWDPVNLREGLRLLALSTTNVIAFLKAVGGAKPERVAFEVPSSVTEFEAPWSRHVAFTSSSFDYVLGESDIDAFTKEEILESLGKPPTTDSSST